MNQERPLDVTELDYRTQQAIRELQSVIAARYPTTTFDVVRGADDPRSIHLLTVVDVDDPDEVGDLVVDRVVSLQVDEGIPLHVIPLRTAERLRAELEVKRHAAPSRSTRSARLLRGVA